MTTITSHERIINACERLFEEYIADCSGFAKAVTAELGIELRGMANDLVDQIGLPPWTILADGIEAKKKADAGYLVIAGLKDDPHGHVAVVIRGPLDPAHGKYPSAYWGSLKGAESAAKNKTVNWAWNTTDRDRVVYACLPI